MPYFVFVDTTAVLVKKIDIVGVTFFFGRLFYEKLPKVFTKGEKCDIINVLHKLNIRISGIFVFWGYYTFF